MLKSIFLFRELRIAVPGVLFAIRYSLFANSECGMLIWCLWVEAFGPAPKPQAPQAPGPFRLCPVGPLCCTISGRRFQSGCPRTEFRGGQRAAVAAGVVEVQAGFGRVIEFARRQVVAHQVAAVVGESWFSSGRVPVEADGIARASGEGFELAAVGPQAQDGGVAVRIRRADVARGADRHVEPASGPW